MLVVCVWVGALAVANASNALSLNATVNSSFSADCHDAWLEFDCEVTDLPVIDDIGIDASIDVQKFEINADLLFDGEKYQILHLSVQTESVRGRRRRRAGLPED